MAYEDMSAQIPSVITDYLGVHTFDSILAECKNYSSTSKAFVKRMLYHFDAFFIVKFLNSFNRSEVYPLIDVSEAGRTILRYYGIRETGDVYEQIAYLDMNG